ncbi:MAG: hypothetical protein EB117_17165, partial [Betaproteobacteria bacterium]|nr:hypothetical protein [Betaproteobacteria bacterium]
MNVLLSSDNSLKTFTVNGVEVVDGESVELDPYTSSVEVVVEASDANATVEVDGGDGLEAGENALTVTVTAANGDVAVYNVTLVVLLSGVIDLSVFTVNGVDVLGLTSNSIDLAPYTTEVEVEVVTVDENATFEITGGTDLQPGENSLTVVVTAPNGDTYEYGVTLVVALGNNTELASFQVNGEDVSDGDVVDLAPYTTEVEVVVETVDPDATFEITGGSELVYGENTLTVVVTAADGETTAEYNVTLNVALGNNVELAVFTVNGSDVADGDYIDLDPYTTEVEVVAEASDPDATVEVSGGSELVYGENTLTVVVTAVDGSKAEYNVVLLVAAGDDTSLSTFTVAGNDVQDGDVVEVDPYTTEVEVVAEATDVDATVDVVGGSELQPGLNSVVVTVVAADGVSFETYVVSVNVALGNNVELSSFIVNGSAVQDGDSVDLGYGVTEVTVLVDTVDLDASYVVSGDTDLVSGENILTVVVTAADGEATATYTVTLNVAFNSDASLALFQVNGLDVVDGAVVDLDPYTSSVEVVAKASDSDATVVIEGGTDLQPGENSLVVTVTAADGETQLVYTVILNVLLSSDNSLKTFTVNGVEVVDGESV